jgi:TPR repeat protein
MPRGRTYLAKACAARYLPACALEAVLVVHLKETSSYPAAREKLEQACKLRERESCHYLAQLELDGTFGPVDERTAGEHFWQACNEGWGAACAALAYMWAKGVGTSVNVEKARKLTSMACALKYEPACEVLRDPSRELPPP